MTYKITDLPKTDTYYVLAMTDTHEVYHFAVTRLIQYLKVSKTRPYAVNVDEALIAQLGRNGIEPEHLLRLASGHAKFNDDPAVLIERKGAHYVIDGNHRIALAIMAGAETVPAWVVKPEVWERFLITDIEGDFDYWAARNSS